MKLKYLIDQLLAFNLDAEVIFATSPVDSLEILSFYTDNKEENIYIDLAYTDEDPPSTNS